MPWIKMLKSELKICAGICLLISTLQAATLTVEVSGIKHSEGMVRVGLYDKASGFPDEHRHSQGKILSANKAVDSQVTVNFEVSKPGEYAVAGYHDVNNNEELDTNLVGIPLEPYGASLGARNLLSPPDYDDAKFVMDGQNKRISIQFE